MSTCFARVVHISNPFDPWNNMEVSDLDESISINDWLKHRYGPDFVEFPTATICYLNGQAIMRNVWDHKIERGDLVQFYQLAGEVVTIIIAVIALIVAVVAVVMMPAPTVPGGTPAPDPVHTRQGQFNRTRPGEPIEVAYGKVRLWPSYAGRSYNLYQNNDQYQYNLFCLGQGYYNIHGFQIEDTPMEDFSEVEYQVVEPGGQMTLFRNNVITSVEVSSIELYGPNQPEYDGWVGPFVINGPATKCDRIEVDTVNPNGLFSTNKKGKLRSATCVFEFERQEIDDVGDPVGDWVTMGTYTLKASSTTPQRRTYGVDVPPARYRIRGRRINDKSGSTRVNHIIMWQSVRAFLENVTEFGDVTMLAVKLRASNNINDNSRSLFNVIATRKLPWYEPGEFSPGAFAEDSIGGSGLLWHPVKGVIGNGIQLVFSGTASPSPTAPYPVPSVTSIEVEDGVVTVNWAPTQTGAFFSLSTLKAAIEANPAASALIQLSYGGDGYFAPSSYELDGGEDIVDIPGVWRDAPEDLIATRSLVWAFCDAFRAAYGGKNLGRFLHMEQLPDLVDFYEDRGEHFDWVFDQKMTMAEVAKAIARVGRGVPMMIGNRMGIIRDEPYSVPSAIFGPDNIVKGSFKREFKFFEFDPYDCVEVEYRNPVTWEVETVKCVLPESTQYNPELIKLSGCLDREHAYHEGMYLAATNRHVRERVTFQTGMEGFIPSFGSLISVSHDLIRVGTSGLVLEADNASIPGKTVLKLTDAVRFGWPELEIPENPDTRSRVIVIRMRNGDVMGPVECEVGEDLRTVITVTPLDLSKFVFDDSHELPIFQFGVADRYAKFYKVKGLKPAGDEVVEVECVNYDARVHSFDTLEAPPLNQPSLPPPVPALPVVTGLVVTFNPDNVYQVTASWNPAYGAQQYTLQQSTDGIVWDDVLITPLTAAQLSIVPGDLWLRVAGINLGQGPWATWSGIVGTPLTPPAPPTGFVNTNVWVMDSAFAWDPTTSDGFDIVIYNDVSDTPIYTTEFAKDELTFTYTRAMAAADGAARKLRFELTAGNLAGDSAPAVIILENALPPAPTSLAVGSPTGSVYPVSWTLATPDDFDRYRVYTDTTPGFTPGPGNKVYEGTTPSTTITATVTTYWVVSSSDVWGAEEVFSAEESIVI